MSETPRKSSRVRLKSEISALETRLRMLDEDVASVERQLAAIRGRRKSVCLELIALEFGVRVGSVVTDTSGRVFKVTSIHDDADGETLWLFGKPRLKDGTWHKRARLAYGKWTVETF